jgi:hypothetical protein
VFDRKLLPLSAILEQQRGVLSHGQAIGAGVSRHIIAGRIESGHWQRLHRGVFATFSGPVPRDALLWGAGYRAVLSHHTAAELWKLSDERLEPIHVSVPRETGMRDIPGVAVHYSSRLPEARHPARLPPQTRLEDTVLDLVEPDPPLRLGSRRLPCVRDRSAGIRIAPTQRVRPCAPPLREELQSSLVLGISLEAEGSARLLALAVAALAA